MCGVTYAQTSLAASTIAQCTASNTGLTTGTACTGGATGGSAINTSGSSLLVVCGLEYGGTLSAPTDNKSNTWNALTNYSSGSFNVRMFYAIPSNASQVGPNHTITFGAGGGGTWVSATFAAFVGTAASTALRGSSDVGNNGASNLSITPSAANDLLVSCVSDNSTNSKTISGWTVMGSVTSTAGETGAHAYMVAPNTSSISWLWSAGGNFAQNGAAFSVGAAVAAGGSLTPAHTGVF
jgi:hypothetical protein